MNVRSVFELLQSLRENPKDPQYWQTYCRLLSALSRADQCLLVEINHEAFEILGSDSQDMDWISRQAGVLFKHYRTNITAAAGKAVLKCSDPDGKLRQVVGMNLSALPCRVAVLNIPARESAQMTELLLRVMLVSDLAVMDQNALVRAAPEKIETQSNNDLITTLELMVRVMDEQHFQAAALVLVNGLAAQLGSSQVVLAWFEKGYMRLKAISHISRFELETDHTRLLESTCEEAFDQERYLVYPNNTDADQILFAHRQLLNTMGASRIHTLPLRRGALPCQATLLIVEQDIPFNRDCIEALMIGLGMLMPWLAQKWADDRWWGARVADGVTGKLSQWIGAEFVWQKIAAITAALVLIYVCNATWPFRLEAGAVLVTDSTRLIGAPFDGYLDQVQATLGDTVKQNAVMARLDVKDLILQEAEIQARMRSLRADEDKARAQNNLVDVEIAQARLAQSQANLDRIHYQRTQADIPAPFAGVIVEGERKDLLGNPVRKGDALFRLARIEGLYAELELPERLIRFLEPRATGEMVLLAQPDQRIPFKITRIVPMAHVKGQQGNQFTIKVAFDQAPESWWRPGMSGIAKINAGRRRIIWLWTYRLTDMLRMRLWW
nr:HlyD family efflux transporter periplasmic adaptor subunit [uncultured Desulfobacter sp.]